MKAKLNPTAVIGTEGSDLYLISGRLYGADDDDVYLVRAPTPWMALDVFREAIGVEVGADGRFILEQDGEPTHFIVNATHFIVNADFVGELI